MVISNRTSSSSKTHQEDNNKFGNYLRQKRLEKGYSLRGFAKMIGKSPTYISFIELGKEKTKSELFIKDIAIALEEDEYKLMFLADITPNAVKQFIKDLYHLANQDNK